MEEKHRLKMVAPIVITVILVLYYIGFFAACVLLPIPFGLKLLFGLVPLLLTGVCVFVLVERIREIRSGEVDDLGQY